MTTRQQHKLYCYIVRHIDENGSSPTYDEMKTALSLKSKSGIHRIVSALEERGLIRRLPQRARAIEILRPPQTMDMLYVTQLLKEIQKSQRRRA